jgi:predicted aspartyl protease
MDDHFAYRGAYVQGLTATGRTTVAVLSLNDARRLGLRKELLELGLPI